MSILMQLTPNQRLEIIKIMTANAWRLQAHPNQISLQQMLTALAAITLPPPTSPMESLFPYPPTTPGLQMASLLGSNSGILTPPPAGASLPPPQPNMYRMPYMEALRNPRPNHPPFQYHPYSYYPPRNSYSTNWPPPSPMAYQPHGGVGPIRNRRQRQVLLRNDNGDVNLFTYNEYCDDENSSLQ